MPTTSRKPFRVLMVTGIYPREDRPHSGTFIKSQVDSLVAAGLDIEVIHPRPGPIALRYATAAVQVFLKTLTGRFDIVHGHFGLWCLAARLQWTTPVVASFLGDDLFGKLLADGSWRKRDELVIHVSRWLCHVVDTVIVKSEGMKRAAAAPEGEIFVIPNGVDFELFRPIPRAEACAALGWDQNRYYVLFGNDPKRAPKNFPLAQAAIESLHQRGIAAELVVANGLPQTQVALYINASKALLLPSFYEGSPNIVKEAMACNVPVVATDVGDVSQVIGLTKGCKVCSFDPDVLAAALEEALLMAGPTTGRADIAHLENSLVAQQVIMAYEHAISRKAKGRRSTSYIKQEIAG